MVRPFRTVDKGTPIFDFIVAHLDDDGKLEASGVTLPDEDVDAGELRWAPGAMDGVFGHHAGSDEANDRGAELAHLIAAAGAKPSRRNLRKVGEALSSTEALEVVDPVISQLGDAGATVGGVQTVGRWLATTSPDRSAVKLGIALMGAAGLDPTEDDLAVVLGLGAHEEFTLFSAVAITNGLPESDRALWSLAERVEGWGRIQCVERLASTEDPEIQDWILRTGFRNSVMDEYLACTAARVGRLHEQLREHPDDREVLTAAGDLLTALIAGGPAEDIDDWTDAAEGVEAYLEAMGRSAETLGDFLAIADIAAFLERDGDWDGRAERGWTATRRDAFEHHCRAILGRERWHDLVRTGLLSDDSAEFWQAQQAAGHLGIDTFDALVAHITADPLGGSWFPAWEVADRERAIELAELARTLLPFSEVGSGPADSLGLGPGSELTSAADWTLQGLRDHEGVGGDLLLIGLRSPSIRNRNMALMALATWSRTIWPDGAEAAVRHALATDPSESVRENAQQLLDGTLS